MKSLFFISFLLGAFALAAEPIYKSVDRHGRVSYAAEPGEHAKAVERIGLLPPPSTADVRRAFERIEQLKTADEQWEAALPEREEDDHATLWSAKTRIQQLPKGRTRISTRIKAAPTDYFRAKSYIQQLPKGRTRISTHMRAASHQLAY